MVKFKIEWSPESKADLFNILQFYIDQNKSSTYSKKLNAKIRENLNLLKSNPEMGKQTDIASVRNLITNHYEIIYELIENVVLIVMIWDSRRNPEFKIKNSKYNPPKGL